MSSVVFESPNGAHNSILFNRLLQYPDSYFSLLVNRRTDPTTPIRTIIPSAVMDIVREFHHTGNWGAHNEFMVASNELAKTASFFISGIKYNIISEFV